MKYPVANISHEGQGWNPYAIADEGKTAFADRVIKDGHYQRDATDVPLTEDQRRELASQVFDRSVAFVEAAKAAKANESAAGPADADKPATRTYVVVEQDLKANKELNAAKVKLGREVVIPNVDYPSQGDLHKAILEAIKNEGAK